MSRSYHEIMEKIEVTDEMFTRILNNVSRQTTYTQTRLSSFPRLRKMVSIAACIAFLLMVGTMSRNAFAPSTPSPGQEMVGAVYGMEECSSITELSQKAGFNVKDISESAIPFSVISTSYTWCWNEFAQIVYEGTDNSLTYRKTRGTDDISGDHNQYEQTVDKVVNGIDITIKGNSDKYYLAIWQTEGLSYTISADEGIELETMLELIRDCTG